MTKDEVSWGTRATVGAESRREKESSARSLLGVISSAPVRQASSQEKKEGGVQSGGGGGGQYGQAGKERLGKKRGWFSLVVCKKKTHERSLRGTRTILVKKRNKDRHSKYKNFVMQSPQQARSKPTQKRGP